MFAVVGITACNSLPENVVKVHCKPKIYPDYTDVTIPVDIAPLNFYLAGECERLDVTVRGNNGGMLHVNGCYADFDIDEWHSIVRANRGGKLKVTVCAKQNGEWTQYKDFCINVSKYALDEWGMTYRLIAPGYEIYGHMGIYQRNLSNFEETAILENTQVPGMCINCHTANRTNPENMVFHVRGDHGATYISTGGTHELLKAKNDSLGGSMVYPYWHPSGKYCAFSTNDTHQIFHSVANERIEVYDKTSDLLIYNVKTHEIIADSLVMKKDWVENTPVFSPDGKTLYFITSRQEDFNSPDDCRKHRYNLCSIAFNPETGKLGNKVDTIFNAVKIHKSVTWPRPSYDGRYIMFTLMDYGYFSVWHQESDLWLLDLATGKARPMTEVNSSRSESLHNWNVNSHWFLFTSRREDGLYTRVYLSSIDDNGNATKPFLLPQKDPVENNQYSLYSYNTPDFTSAPVRLDKHGIGKAISNRYRVETRIR